MDVTASLSVSCWVITDVLNISSVGLWLDVDGWGPWEPLDVDCWDSLDLDV